MVGSGHRNFTPRAHIVSKKSRSRCHSRFDYTTPGNFRSQDSHRAAAAFEKGIRTSESASKPVLPYACTGK